MTTKATIEDQQSERMLNAQQLFKEKRSKYIFKWALASSVASIAAVTLSVYEKSNRFTDLSHVSVFDLVTIVITVTGITVSIIAFYFSVNVAYSSIIDAVGSQEVLGVLQTITSDIQKLIEPMADATRRPLTSLTECLEEIALFLDKSADSDQLYILTDTSAIGRIHTHNSRLNTNDFNHCMASIHRSMISRVHDVKDFKIAYLDDDNLISKYIEPVLDSIDEHCGGSINNREEIKNDLIKFHASTIRTMQEESIFNQNKNNGLAFSTVRDIPFQLFLRKKGLDYRAIIVFIGSYNTRRIQTARGTKMGSDVELIKSLFTLFDSFIESQQALPK
jgi:hypothetical protein